MEQIKDYSDERLFSGCVYCGLAVATREHVPSKAFLDSPYPENLPVVGACKECNEGFSRDEQYVACLIEVARVGCSDPSCMRRSSIASTLERSVRLRALIDAGRVEVNGGVQYNFDKERLRRVLIKLAMGHACYELSVWNLGVPDSLWWAPLYELSEPEREEFDEPFFVKTLGEIGSRAVSRMMVIQPSICADGISQLVLEPMIISDWLDVQANRYRFLAVDDGGEIVISILIAEYLAARVIWKRP